MEYIHFTLGPGSRSAFGSTGRDNLILDPPVNPEDDLGVKPEDDLEGMPVGFWATAGRPYIAVALADR